MDGTDIFRQALASRSLLGLLPAAGLDELVAQGALLTYPAGAVLYRTGEVFDRLLVVQSGTIRLLMRSPTGRALPLRVLGPGGVDGDVEVLGNCARLHDATIAQSVDALLLTRREILAALARHPAVLPAITAALAGRLQQAEVALERTHLQERARLTATLLRLVDKHGRPLPDGILIDLALSQTGLAAHAGLARDVASRELMALRDLSLVRAQGAHIVVLDRDALQDYAELAAP